MHRCDRLWTRLYTLLIAGQFESFGQGARVSPPFRHYGLHRMRFGEKVNLERDCWVQTIGSSADNEVKLVIGARANIGMGACISAAKMVNIGEHVLLARNVYISDHSHAYEDITIPIVQQGINNLKPVSIGRNTWLGQNVVVLPGVSIGQHCVIGANSIVKQSIPDFCVAVGAPARVVKRHNPQTSEWESVSTMAEEALAGIR